MCALPKNGQHVVLAHREVVDVLHHHHLVVLLGEERGVEHLLHVLVIARGQVLVGLGHPGGRPLQALAARVLAELLQEVADQALHRVQVAHRGLLVASPQYSNELLAVSITATRSRSPGGSALRQPVPERAGQVLAGGDHALELGHRAGEIVVVDALEEHAAHGGVQGAEIGGHSGDGIEGARQRHLHHVVVAVRAVALAIHPLVLGRRQGRAGQPVPGAEMIGASEPVAAHGPRYSTWKVGSSQRRRR